MTHLECVLVVLYFDFAKEWRSCVNGQECHGRIFGFPVILEWAPCYDYSRVNVVSLYYVLYYMAILGGSI